MAKSPAHVLVFIDGQTLTGQAKPKVFTVKTDFGDFKIQASRISYIHFENGNPAGVDEVVLVDTSELRGDVLPDPLPFTVAATGETMEFPQKKLHTLVMFGEGI